MSVLERISSEEHVDRIKRAEVILPPERLYSLLVKKAHHFGLSMLDKEGRILYWNEGAAKITGYDEAEALGKEFSFLFTPEDRELGVPRHELERALHHGQADDERWQLHKSGERYWSSGLTSPVMNELGAFVGFSKIFRENTLRKQTEDEIKAANSRLSQFAYVASHDLKEPLRMVTSFLSLLERRNDGKLDKDSLEFLHFALDGSRRMRALIDSVLEFSSIGVANRHLRRSELGAIVDGAISFLKFNIEECKAVVTRSPMPILTVFPSQLEQVFQNLISNAVKYRGDRQPRIFIDALEREKDWVFSMRDNGIGIKMESLPRIFLEFERVPTAEDYPGTGLGLSICTRIVERHGGEIWVTSEVGVGSTFYFTIPKEIRGRFFDSAHRP